MSGLAINSLCLLSQTWWISWTPWRHLLWTLCPGHNSFNSLFWHILTMLNCYIIYIYNPLWKLGTAPAILDLLNRSQKTMERPLAVSSTQVPSMSGRGLQQTMQQHYSQQYENKRQRSLAKIAVFRRSEGIRGSMVQVQWCNSAVQLWALRSSYLVVGLSFPSRIWFYLHGTDDA